MGRGGAAYEAQDTVLGRRVAVKRLRSSDLEHLLQGSPTRASFQHPNIASIFAIEEDDEGTFVVMERIHGDTLLETIEASAFSRACFIDFVEQALDGLVAAHEAGFCHRGIQPEKLMLKWGPHNRFQIKFLDFGLAESPSIPSKPGMSPSSRSLSSVHYTTSEPSERHLVEAQSDLHAFGCVCYFALTQRHPFDKDSPANTPRARLEREVTPLSQLRPDLDPAISAWVMGLISLEPKRRPITARATLRLFRKALAEDCDLSITLHARKSRSRPTLSPPLPIAARTLERGSIPGWWSLSRVLGNMLGGAIL